MSPSCRDDFARALRAACSAGTDPFTDIRAACIARIKAFKAIRAMQSTLDFGVGPEADGDAAAAARAAAVAGNAMDQDLSRAVLGLQQQYSGRMVH
jgi:hypothetical protein